VHALIESTFKIKNSHGNVGDEDQEEHEEHMNTQDEGLKV